MPTPVPTRLTNTIPLIRVTVPPSLTRLRFGRKRHSRRKSKRSRSRRRRRRSRR